MLAATMVAVVAGCGRRQRETPAVQPAGKSLPAAAQVPSTPPPPLPPAPRFFPEPAPADQVLDRLESAPIRWFEPMGRTSMVFRLVFEDGSRAIFEPATHQYPVGYRAEVAAYRIARFLGLDNVPPVITRRVTKDELKQRLDPTFHDAWDDIQRWTSWQDDGSVIGAVAPWVGEVRALDLVDDDAVRRWSRWLDGRRKILDSRMPFVRDLSNMLAFDYLIGDWDRFESPLQGTPDGRRLFLRDHDRAFAAPLPPVLHRRVLDRLLLTQRFSRAFVHRLAELDRRAIERELGADPGQIEGEPLLTDAQLSGILDRREALLSYIGSLVAEQGRRAVLSLP